MVRVGVRLQVGCCARGSWGARKFVAQEQDAHAVNMGECQVADRRGAESPVSHNDFSFGTLPSLKPAKKKI